MIDKEKDKLIAKALAICLHEWKETQLSPYSLPIRYECEKCGGIGFGTLPVNPDFSTWEGFGLIMERGPGRKWWEAFSYCMQQTRTPYAYWRKDLWPIDLLNPTKTHDTLFSWLSENEGEWREK